MFCDWSVRWGRRSSRSGCCGSGWTAALRRVGFWWPCRRAPGGGTTRLSLRWWRSGWTVTGSSPLVQLSPMERRKRRTKTSEEQSALLDTTTRPSCVPQHTHTHTSRPHPTERQTQAFLFWFLSLIRQLIWVCCKIKECNDCICLYRVCSLLLFVLFLICCFNACSDLRNRGRSRRENDI